MVSGTSLNITEILQSQDLNIIDAITILESTVKSLEIINNDIDAMNVEIQAAAAFAEHLGIDAASDFKHHHRYRKPPSRIDENPNTTAAFSMDSFYRKEFKAVLDTQINTFADIHNNCKETTKPLIDALHPGKELPSLQTFKDLAEFFPEDQRPNPDAFMSEIEIFRSHMTSTSENVKYISDAARIAEQQNQSFLLLTELIAWL